MQHNLRIPFGYQPYQVWFQISCKIKFMCVWLAGLTETKGKLSLPPKCELEFRLGLNLTKGQETFLSDCLGFWEEWGAVSVLDLRKIEQSKITANKPRLTNPFLRSCNFIFTLDRNKHSYSEFPIMSVK
jgi:hypothetical protein